MIKQTLYAQYIREREGFEIIESEDYFVIYKIRNNELFIAHMYVKPKLRKHGLAGIMTRELKKIAKLHNCKGIVGTIDLSVGDPSNTLHAALKIGFKVYKAIDDIIIIGINLT